MERALVEMDAEFHFPGNQKVIQAALVNQVRVGYRNQQVTKNLPDRFRNKTPNQRFPFTKLHLD
jgi:hypothetical protein